ncbi:MAG: hypothetical protein PHG65_08965 [Kiritimatiellae bacterium]|nr:hypothetical protein [Kiritimatiellia bacterium]
MTPFFLFENLFLPDAFRSLTFALPLRPPRSPREYSTPLTEVDHTLYFRQLYRIFLNP